MKKIALLTVAVLLFSQTACNNVTKNEVQNGATLEVDLSHSYASELLDLELGDFTEICFGTEQGVFLTYNGKDNLNHVALWHIDSGELEVLELHEENPDAIFSMPNGGFGVYRSNYDTVEMSATLDCYDKSLQYIETKSLSISNYLYPGKAVFDSEGQLFYLDGQSHITVCDDQMQEKGVIKINDAALVELFLGASEEVYARLWNGHDASYAHVNSDTMELETLSVNSSQILNPIPITGVDDYEFFISGESGIYGVKLSDAESVSELVLDYPNSDLTYIIQVTALPDGSFFVMEGDDNSIYIAKKREQEEQNSIKIISLAGVNLQWFVDDVADFNRSQSEYRIVIEDYVKYADEGDYTYAAGIEKFQQDLISGTMPDIVCTDSIPFEPLANKGMFEDLSVFLEEDERFREEDYLMNFFESLKYAGKLHRIGFSYQVLTYFGKTEFAGNKQGLTPEEYLQMVQNMPKGMTLFREYTREQYAQGFLPVLQNCFVDKKTMTCAFNDPAFVQLMEAGNTLPDHLPELQVDEAYYLTFADNKALLESFNLCRPIQYHEEHAGTFRNEDITLVGYPVMDGGNGGIFYPDYTLSLNTQSQQKEGAWEFIMYMLSEEYQRNLDVKEISYYMPVLRSALDEDLTTATKGAGRTTWMGNGYVNTGNATEEEMTILKDYIEHITQSYYVDLYIANIISEEAEMYYAGDQTAEKASSMIQDRVSLYLAEQS